MLWSNTLVDGVAAVVGDKIITHLYLNEQIELVLQGGSLSGASDELLREEVLESIINQLVF